MKWPQGWREVPFQPALGKVVRGVTFSREDASDEPISDGIPVLRAGNIQERLITDRGLVWIPKTHVSNEQVLQRGDVVVCTSSGSVHLVGKAALLDHEFYGTFGAFNAVMRCDPSMLLPEYLHLWLTSPLFDQWRSRLVAGANIQNIRQSDLEALRIVAPPLPEQQRIVEVLKEADLQTFQEAAEKAQMLYKTLVCAAFSHRLTTAWRTDNKALLHDAARIRDGLLGIKDTDTDSWQEWQEVLLSDVIESAQPGFAQRPGEEDEGSTPQIRTHNVSPDGRITFEGIKHVTVAEGDLERFRLLPGDVIFNNTNSEEWVGKTALFDQREGVFVYSNHMTRIRVRRELLLPEFLAAYLHFLWAVGYARNRAKRWVSQAAIDAPTLLKFKIPLPPLPEQQRIVEVLSAADLQPFFQRIDHAKRLQNALIAEALSGRLTATWREQHAQELAEAARERDARLGAPTPQVFTERAPAERRTDLARPRRQALIDQLSSFQHAVWNTLRFEWRGAVLVDDPAAFEEFCTSPQTAWRLDGFSAGREEVRRALEQLAAMGLIRKMSLPRFNPSTRRTEYLTACRPLREAEDGSRPKEDTALTDAERLARELERRVQESR